MSLLRKKLLNIKNALVIPKRNSGHGDSDHGHHHHGYHKNIFGNWESVPIYRRQMPQLSEDNPEWKAVYYCHVFFWAMAFWQFYHKPDIALGHYLPDPKKWTDEELGIPPDDYPEEYTYVPVEPLVVSPEY